MKRIQTLPDFMLDVEFDDGRRVLYDVKDDIEHTKGFDDLYDNEALFQNFRLDESRTIVSWSDQMDLPSDMIYEYGVKAE
jgi:hypothetical protein